MRIVVVLTLAAVAVSGFLAAGSIAGTESSDAGQATAASTVSLRKTLLGQVLVNSRGRTLYLFAKDKSGTSACSGPCAQFWPPLLSATKPTAGLGVKRLLLGRTKRSNGSMQVTYNGHPLYTYARDTQAGQTNGQGSSGFGARWWAVSARGTAIVKAPIETTPPPTNPTIPTTTAGYCDYPPCP
jgi:predicted lipoprotein with Yx(FWY)xxD motif